MHTVLQNNSTTIFKGYFKFRTSIKTAEEGLNREQEIYLDTFLPSKNTSDVVCIIE